MSARGKSTRERARAIAAAALLLVFAWPAARAEEPKKPAAPAPKPPPPPEEGDLAPEDGWATTGGSLSRSGETRTRPVRGDLETAWTFPLKGEPEGEPRAWGNRVFVVENAGEGRRLLHVLDVATGKPIYRHVFDKTDGPLEPCVGPGRVVVRASSTSLVGFAVGETMLTPRWKAAGREFSGPLLAGDEVYARDGGGVARWSFTRSEPVWRTEIQKGYGVSRGAPLVATGSLALRGSAVYVAAMDEIKNGYLVALDRPSGATNGKETFVGPAEAFHESGSDEPMPVVGSKDVFLRFPRAFRASGEAPVNAAWAERDPFDSRIDRMRTLLALLQDVAITRDTWLGVTTDPKSGAQLVRPNRRDADGRTWYDVYAGADFHPGYVDPRVPAVVAGGVAYLGGRAFELESRDVLRDQDKPCAVRPVPARGVLLMVDAAKRTVVAWRGSRRPGGPAALVPAAPPGSAAGTPVVLEAATIVLDEGAVKTGAFALDTAAGTIAAHGNPKDKSSWPLGSVRAVLAKSRELLFARDVAEAARALDEVVTREVAAAWLALAVESSKAGDVVGARRRAEAARTRGAPDAEVEKVLKSLAKAGKPASEETLAALRAKEGGLGGGAADALWRTFAAVPDADLALRAALLDEVFARAAAHAGAAEWVRKQLPEGLVPPEPFDAPEWLRFVVATRRTPIRLVDVAPGAPERGLSASQRELGALRASWRKDVVGFESAQILLLTRVVSPGRIALTLSRAELVCATLEKIFASGDKKRDDRQPLVLILCQSQEEYLGLTRGMDGGRRRGVLDTEDDPLERSAGHYDPSKNVSRVFLPDGEEAFEDAAEAFAYVVTQQWIDLRCPLFSDADRFGSTASTPGVWVEVGFPTFVERFRFDAAADRVETLDPRAREMVLVANAHDTDHLPWVTVLSADTKTFRALPDEPSLEVPFRWRLGWRHVLSARALFFAQSAVACSYFFHAEEGRHRKALVEHVVAVETGRAKAGDVEARFGATPEELGKRIVAWARATVAR